MPCCNFKPVLGSDFLLSMGVSPSRRSSSQGVAGEHVGGCHVRNPTCCHYRSNWGHQAGREVSEVWPTRAVGLQPWGWLATLPSAHHFALAVHSVHLHLGNCCPQPLTTAIHSELVDGWRWAGSLRRRAGWFGHVAGVSCCQCLAQTPLPPTPTPSQRKPAVHTPYSHLSHHGYCLMGPPLWSLGSWW